MNMLTLPKLLQQRSSIQPDKTAYIFLRNGEKESARLTYKQLDEQARAMAASLQNWQGERALLLYASELDFIIAFFGCLYAGVVAVPAYPPRRNQKLSRLRAIAYDAQIAIGLTTASVLTKINCRWQEEPILAKLHWIATDQLSTTAEDWRPQIVTPDKLAFLQYTSGSTGTPKGVMVNHRNIIHNSQIIKQNFGHTEETIFVGWLPLFHDMGLIGNVLQPMYLGIPCILMPPIAFLQKPIRWLKAISRYRATTSGGPNFAYDLCVQRIKSEQLANLDLSSWEVAFNGGEPVRAKTLARFTKTFAEYGFRPQVFHPCYGMAENTLFISGGVTSKEPRLCLVEAAELEKNRVVKTDTISYTSIKSVDGDEQKFNKSTLSYDRAAPRLCRDLDQPISPKSIALVSSGGSWQGQKIVIAKVESLTQCGEGEVGEILVSGDSVAQGYWNCAEKHQYTFQTYLANTGEGPFLRTGDLGFVLDGELFVTGRLKDVMIIRGQNHYPQDIELTVENSHNALRPNSGAAFTVEVQGKDELVVVQEVERTYLRKLDILEVIGNITQAVTTEHGLNLYKTTLVKPGTIAKTSSGKIQRHLCKMKFLDGSLVGHSLKEPE